MPESTEPQTPSTPLTRRRIVQCAAWSVPAVAVAFAAPAVAASTCTPPTTTILTTSSANYSRSNTGLGLFTFADVFGKTLTITVTATAENGYATLRSTNLNYATGTIGGQGNGGLDLALTNLSTPTVGGAGEHVTFTFAYDGSPITVTGLSFRLAGIDGWYTTSVADGLGAERVFLTGLTGGTAVPMNTNYLQGSGTNLDRWVRRKPSTPDAVVPGNAGTDSAVSVSGASTSAFTVNYRLAYQETATFDMFITPLTFTVTNPAC